MKKTILALGIAFLPMISQAAEYQCYKAKTTEPVLKLWLGEHPQTAAVLRGSAVYTGTYKMKYGATNTRLAGITMYEITVDKEVFYKEDSLVLSLKSFGGELELIGSIKNTGYYPGGRAPMPHVSTEEIYCNYVSE